MRRFWFGLSLALVFGFAAVSSYIMLVLAADDGAEVDEPYKAVSEVEVQVPTVTEDMQVTVRQTYACGYQDEQTDAGELLGLSFDQLSRDGWDVAKVGENRLEISREQTGLCPIEDEQRLLCRTERGLAVYRGAAAHRGPMLLEMPLNFAELPPDLAAALDGEGYQLASQGELDELLESLDELIMAAE